MGVSCPHSAVIHLPCQSASDGPTENFAGALQSVALSCPSQTRTRHQYGSPYRKSAPSGTILSWASESRLPDFQTSASPLLSAFSDEAISISHAVCTTPRSPDSIFQLNTGRSTPSGSILSRHRSSDTLVSPACPAPPPVQQALKASSGNRSQPAIVFLIFIRLFGLSQWFGYLTLRTIIPS